MIFFRFYLLLQLKKSMRIMRDVFISMLCVILVIAGSALVIKALLQSRDDFEKVRVGIVVTDDSRQTENIFRLLYAMESVNTICTFTYVDEDEVEEQLASGKLKAALVIAPDFYDDVNYGTNTPVQLLLSEEKDFETTFFYELVMDGCGLIQITEAEIYAMTEVMEVYETEITIPEMQDFFTKIYIENILRRYDAFEKIVLSPTGEYNLTQHYFIAVFCILLLMTGLNYSLLYRREELAILRVLKREGFDSWKCSFAKTTAMALQLWIIALCVYGISCGVCYLMSSALMSFHWMNVVLLGIVAFGVASYFHMMYSWFGDSERSGLILFVTNLFMLLLCGAVLPVTFLPGVMESIHRGMPLTLWWNVLGETFFQEMKWMDGLKVIIQAALCEGIGIWGICKRA